MRQRCSSGSASRAASRAKAARASCCSSIQHTAAPNTQPHHQSARDALPPDNTPSPLPPTNPPTPTHNPRTPGPHRSRQGQRLRPRDRRDAARHLQGAGQGPAARAARGGQGQVLQQAGGEEDQGGRRRVRADRLGGWWRIVDAGGAGELPVVVM